MTCYVSSGTLNPTRSHHLVIIIIILMPKYNTDVCSDSESFGSNKLGEWVTEWLIEYNNNNNNISPLVLYTLGHKKNNNNNNNNTRAKTLNQISDFFKTNQFISILQTHQMDVIIANLTMHWLYTPK